MEHDSHGGGDGPRTGQATGPDQSDRGSGPRRGPRPRPGPGPRAAPVGPRGPRSLAADDGGVSQVVGFVLMFAVAFMVLSLALILVSSQVQEKTRRDQRSTFAEAAATVASAIQEAVAIADLYPNATFHRAVSLPEGIAQVRHEMTVTNRSVYLNTTGGGPQVRVQAGGFDLAAEDIAFERTVTRSSRVLITYKWEGGAKTLTLDDSP